MQVKMTCSDWITLCSAVVTASLGIIALFQNCRYKKQANDFADMQYMPEFFIQNRTGSVDNEIEFASLGYGYGLSIGNFVMIKGPIYRMCIQQVFIDNERVNQESREYSEPSDRNDLSIPPTNPIFSLKISIPENYIDGLSHKCNIVLTYENMYNTKYEKKIEFKFVGYRTEKISQNITIQGDIILNRAQRSKN